MTTQGQGGALFVVTGLSLLIITGASLLVGIITLGQMSSLAEKMGKLEAQMAQFEQGQTRRDEETRTEMATQEDEEVIDVPPLTEVKAVTPAPPPKPKCTETRTKVMAVDLTNPTLEVYAPLSPYFMACGAKDKEISLVVTPNYWSAIMIVSSAPFVVNKSAQHAPGVVEVNQLRGNCGYCSGIIFGEYYSTGDYARYYVKPEFQGAFPKNTDGTYNIPITPSTNDQIFFFSGKGIAEM